MAFNALHVAVHAESKHEGFTKGQRLKSNPNHTGSSITKGHKRQSRRWTMGACPQAERPSNENKHTTAVSPALLHTKPDLLSKLLCPTVACTPRKQIKAIDLFRTSYPPRFVARKTIIARIPTIYRTRCIVPPMKNYSIMQHKVARLT